MTTTLDTPTTCNTTGRRAPMTTSRKASLAGGLFYVLTFAASIPAVLLLRPVLNDPTYIVSAGADTRVTFGAFLDLVTALTGIGTAVALFPVIKRQSESFALGFVTTRMFEAAVIIIGVVSLLTVLTLRQPGADAHSLVMTGKALVGVRDWTFLLGPNVMAGLNALLLGTVMYRSGLVPRVIPVIGLVGAPLILAVTFATMFGLTEHGSAWWALAAPIFVWELSLGLYMAIKGFKPVAIVA
ncbi:MAG: hypothetical protein JWO46_1267 [Nocardioidaceae bacterium]|nr:hypothetical protein [Nocardioidaceae bacterium]